MIIGIAADEAVVAAVAKEPVAAIVAADAIIAASAVEVVAAAEAADDVLACATEDCVIAKVGKEAVVASFAENLIVAALAVQLVVAVAAEESVVVGAAEDDVVAAAGFAQDSQGNNKAVAVAHHDIVIAEAGIDDNRLDGSAREILIGVGVEGALMDVQLRRIGGIERDINRVVEFGAVDGEHAIGESSGEEPTVFEGLE